MPARHITLTMLKSITAICLFGLGISAHAAGTTLKAQIKGTDSRNRYFLCIGDDGCFSLNAAAHGKTFPLTEGKLRQAFLVNIQTHRMYAQNLPTSCAIELPENHTLHLTGTLNTTGKTPTINQLHCNLTG